MKAVKVVNLEKEYRLGTQTVHALRSISLEVEPGAFVAVMGPSGSGKSTLLHLMGGLEPPTAGEILLADTDLSGVSAREATLIRRRQIGFVFQFFNLLPTLSVEENILLPLIIDKKNTRDHQEELDRLLRRVGLEERRQHRPDQLSGGEQQRVALARALITHPAILLADEPTGNLDTATGNAMMNLLRDSARELQQTVVMVTHDPKAAAYAQRVVFLMDGRIREELLFEEEETAADRLHRLLTVQERMEP